jgi:TetR/AcrR family tetracycline transcriptional repressor
MRALARELGVSPMAAYHHVGNKEDLLALIIDDVLSQIKVPPKSAGTWEQRLRDLNRSSTAAVASCLDQITFNTRPTTEGWRLIDAYLEILLDGGFTEREATLGFSVIHSYGMGRSSMELEIRRSNHDGVDAPEDSPSVQRTWQFWSELHKPDYRDFAIEVIIAGLRAVRDTARAQAKAQAKAAGAKPERTPTKPRATRRPAATRRAVGAS